MATEPTVQITPQGVLIPRIMIQDWEEIEVITEAGRIIIQSKLTSHIERQQVLQVLDACGLLLPVEPLPPNHASLSPNEQNDLMQAFSKGEPLSTIIIREREE